MTKLKPIAIVVMSLCASSYVLAAEEGTTITHLISDGKIFTAKSGDSISEFDSVVTRVNNGGVWFPVNHAVNLSGQSNYGVIISGSNSFLSSSQTSHVNYNLNGIFNKGVRVEYGGQAQLFAGTNLNITGDNSIGIQVDNQQTTDDNEAIADKFAATSVTSSANIVGSGDGVIGFAVANGASLTQQGRVMLTGDDTTGIVADSGSTVTHSGVLDISNGVGLDINNSDAAVIGNGTINVDNGKAGVRLGSGASLLINGNDTQITTGGTAHGIELNSGAEHLSVTGTALDVKGSGNGVENGAEISNVSLTNMTIQVNNGSGIRTATGFDTLTNVTTTVTGSGTGFNFTRADDSASSNNLTLGSGYRVNVEGAGGVGVRANTTGNVYNAATVRVNDVAGGAAFLSAAPLSLSNSGTLASLSEAAPVVDLSGGQARLSNFGTIAAASATARAILGSAADDTVILRAGSVFGEIDTGAGSDKFEWTGGTLNGGVSLGAGDNNQARVKNVDLSNTAHITSGDGSGNILTFSQVVGSGGSLAKDDPARGVNLGSGWSTINLADNSQWTLTSDLKLAGSELNISPDSVLYAGNEVSPQITSADNALVVNNSGTIDLTNGTGLAGNTLVINGDLNSTNGLVKLNTRLNEGGALSNQFTDRLLVNGNANSGTTLLDVEDANLSDGALTDINRSGTTENNEGISVVQVSGQARADSFRLQGGYAAVGPWRYELFSFAPGSSDASQRLVAGGTDNQFWDYRLANGLICEDGSNCNGGNGVGGDDGNSGNVSNGSGSGGGSGGGSGNSGGSSGGSGGSSGGSGGSSGGSGGGSGNGNGTGSGSGNSGGSSSSSSGRLAVIPQVPSYISAPVGLAYYSASIIDDLHKRLGELRQQQNNPDAKGGEMFLRYSGADYSYKSNVAFQQFGYDMDLSYNAVQIGGNLLKLDGPEDSLRGGIAYTRGHSRLNPKAVDGASSTSFDSNSFALFGTWQRNDGFYVDGALSYDLHRGETDIGRHNEVGKLQGRGWSASVETGYPFMLGNDIYLEPQAQLMYMRLNMDDFTDKDGTTVKYDSYTQTVGRLGARLNRTWKDEAGRQYTPYVQADYYRGFGGGSQTTIGADSHPNLDETFTGGRYGQMASLGAGGTATFTNDVSLYAGVDYRRELEGNGVKGWQYNAGVRWEF